MATKLRTPLLCLIVGGGCAVGAQAQSSLVFDLARGALSPGHSSAPEEMTPFSGRVAFRADDGAHGREPWISDGTPAGTQVLRDIAPGSEGSDPAGFLAHGASLVFSAWDPCAGREPWWSDGTEGGTRRLADVRPGPDDSGARSFAAWGSSVVFTADDGVHGMEPWITDGTEAGTRLLGDVVPGSAGSEAAYYVTAGSTLVFFVKEGAGGGRMPWRTDGTPAGTYRLRMSPGVGAHYSVMSLGPVALFGFDDGMTGVEPWVTDGTVEGTRLLADAFPGTSGYPHFFGRIGARALFAVRDSWSQARTWVTDGTPMGTRPLGGDDFPPLDRSFGMQGGILWAGTWGAVFTTDGTEAGTTLRASFSSFLTHGAVEGSRCFVGTSDGAAHRVDAGGVMQILPPPPFAGHWPAFTPIPGAVAFCADDAEALGKEPWISDGTIAGTRRIADLLPGHGDAGSSPALERLGAARAVAAARATGEPKQMYLVDDAGDDAVTRLTSLPSGSLSEPQWLLALGDRVLFTAATGAAGREPWVTDGTVAGTFMLADVRPGSAGSMSGGFARWGDRAVFVANDGSHGPEPWITDGTSAGTRLIADINPAEGSSPSWFSPAGGLLYFQANDGRTGDELWVTDGTAAGTRLVADMVSGSGSSYPRRKGWLGSRFVVFMDDGVHGVEAMRIDSPGAAPVLVADVTPGAGSTWPEDLAVAGGRAFFAAWFGPTEEPWVTDGTAAGTFKLATIATESGGRIARAFTPFGNECAFLVESDSAWSRWDLWISDGTPAGTRCVLKEATGEQRLTVVDGLLVFARETAAGIEPWVSDGRSPGHLIEDVNRGSASSHPSSFVAAGDRMLFAADDGVHGLEIRAVPLAALHAVAGPACSRAWGDVVPPGSGDGRVDIADVVRLLRLSVGLEAPTADDLARGDVAPCTQIAAGPPPVMRPELQPVPRIDIGDVVVALRAAVGLVRLSD